MCIGVVTGWGRAVDASYLRYWISSQEAVVDACKKYNAQVYIVLDLDDSPVWSQALKK